MKKKSGAARRLVSLVLALGLIFTLAPASVFAGDEVPVSSTAVTTVEEPAVEATEPAVEGTEPAEEGTEPAVEGTEPAEEGTEPAVEGTEPAEEGTEPAVEGTEPTEEEVPAQQAALVAASVPAVMGAAPREADPIDSVFTFSQSSSDNVQVAYAFDGGWFGGHTGLTNMKKGDNFTKTMHAGYAVAFFIKVDEGYDISSFEGGAGVYLPLTEATAPKGLQADYEQALAAGYDYVFKFESLGVRRIEFVIKTELAANVYTVSVNDSVLTGSDFEPALPHNVTKGDSVSVTLNESMVYPMLTLSVNGQPLNLPWNLEKMYRL